MKLKNVVKSISSEEILIISEWCRPLEVIKIWAGTIHDKCACSSYNEYMKVENWNVVSIEAKGKGIIKITIKDEEGE